MMTLCRCLVGMVCQSVQLSNALRLVVVAVLTPYDHCDSSSSLPPSAGTELVEVLAGAAAGGAAGGAEPRWRLGRRRRPGA